MTDDEKDFESAFGDFFSEMRKNASIKAGAAMFGEAQVVYFDVLKQHMSEEMAYNMLAHTTESLLRAIATGAGPVVSAFLSANALMEHLGLRTPESNKEVPGS